MTITLGQVAAICAALVSIGGLLAAIARWLDGRFERQITAVVAQLDARIERAVADARKAAGDGLRLHDTDPVAHANHSNPQRQRLEMEKVAAAITEIATRLAVIDERIKTGQEMAAQRWATLDEQMASLTSLEHRVTRLESDHATLHRLNGGGRA